MRLRTDVHMAFDAIAPATGGMTERIVETARVQARIRNGRRRFMLRMRAPLALVAALLLIAIIAAVVVGSRLWQSWSAPHSPIHVGAALPTLEELEARPWQHEVLRPGEDCSGKEVIGPRDGHDPVYPNPINLKTYSWGEYSYGDWIFEKGFAGLAIVRLRDGQKGTNHFFIYEGAGGPIVGTLAIDGQTVAQHAEAVVDFSNRSIKADANGWKTFRLNEGHLKGFSLCFEWQVDGTYQGRPFVRHWYFAG